MDHDDDFSSLIVKLLLPPRLQPQRPDIVFNKCKQVDTLKKTLRACFYLVVFKYVSVWRFN